MSLSCSCDFDGDPTWYWWPPEEYATYEKLKAKRCACDGCTTLIKWGAICGVITRSRPATEWEEMRGIGDEDPESVWLASEYMCEECTDLYFSFQDLGFECVSPYENMRELSKEYHSTYGVKTK